MRIVVPCWSDPSDSDVITTQRVILYIFRSPFRRIEDAHLASPGEHHKMLDDIILHCQLFSTSNQLWIHSRP